MARKTKEKIDENDEITKKTTSRASRKSTKTSTKVALEDVSTKDTKKTPKKTKSSKSTSSTTRKSSKLVEKVSAIGSKIIKKASSASSKIAKKVLEPKKNASTNKSSSSKASTRKSTKSAKETKSTKKELEAKTTKKDVNAKTTKPTNDLSENEAKILPIEPLEYYDLPYRYNQTVVKVLAQNPNTLFVYWDISDTDRENFEAKYGKMFFYNTRPVLIVHNLTTNYTFEIDIDDFANNWYVHVNNTKCKYFIELGRRPKYEQQQDIPVNYLNVAFSNVIEIPNDHILFFKENDKVYFKNVKTNKVIEKTFKKNSNLNKVKEIYKNYNLSENEDKFDFKNPSSQNPTSTFL